STSSSPRAPRAAATPARSALGCCGPRGVGRGLGRPGSPRGAQAPRARARARTVLAERARSRRLGAGGIGRGRQIAAALAMGAQGVWTGSIWLSVEEAEASPPQLESYFNATSKDTVRSRSWTGKPARMLRNDWTEAWEQPGAPKY